MAASPAPAFEADAHVDECCGCGEGGELLCCDSCPRAFHAGCVGLAAPPEGEWACPACARLGGAFGGCYGGDSHVDLCFGCGGAGRLVCCDTCPNAFHPGCAGLAGEPDGSWRCPVCEGSASHEELRQLRARKRRRRPPPPELQVELQRALDAELRAAPVPRECALCREPWRETDEAAEWEGPLRDEERGVDLWTHRECAIWSPRVFLGEGGRLQNVLSEVRRAAQLPCSGCARRGASIGCNVAACERSFHLRCAERAGCFLDARGYRLLCVEHFTARVREALGGGEPESLSAVALFDAAAPLRRELRECVGEPAAADKARESGDAHLEPTQPPPPPPRALLALEGSEFMDDGDLRRAQREWDALAREAAERRARLSASCEPPWAQVGGLEEARRALHEAAVLPLLYPELLRRLGAQPPRGVLLHGPPGTGKTLLVRELARASGLALFVRAPGEVLSRYYGETERQLRMLFAQAREHAPALVFFDELDGLAPARSAKHAQVHNSVVTTLLALLDGLDARGRVVVLAATNRIDAVDPALRRPGRFDREVFVGPPSFDERLAILRVRTRVWRPPPPDALLRDVARRAHGCTGAHLGAVCAEALLAALRRRPQPRPGESGEVAVEGEVNEADWARALAKVAPTSSEAHSSSAQSEAALARLLVTGRALLAAPTAAEAARGVRAVLQSASLAAHAVFDLRLGELLAAEQPEQVLVQRVRDWAAAGRAVLLLPDACEWWSRASRVLRAALLCLLRELAWRGEWAPAHLALASCAGEGWAARARDADEREAARFFS